MKPAYRRRLNGEQVEILELLYKFRFGTVALIKDYFAESNPGMDVFRKLQVLAGRGFVGKRYLAGYKLLHKPVAYYLLPAGARTLGEYRESEDADAINLKAVYRNGIVKEPFIEHGLELFNVYNCLSTRYGDDLTFFTKNDLNHERYKHFPKPLPDGFLVLNFAGNDRYFFLEVFEDALPFFTIVRTINRYIEYRKSGNWAATGTSFPVILFVCESPSLQKRTHKRIITSLRKELLDITFATTTKTEVQAIDDGTDEIWRKTDESGAKLSLRSIS